MVHSVLNGVIESNLSNDQSVKVIKFPGATVDNLQDHPEAAEIFNYSRRN